MIAPIRLREFQELPVEREETASTAVNPTTSPETAHRVPLLASVVRAEARVPEATTATDAVSLVTWPETAPTLQLRETRDQEVETVSVAASWVTWPETAPTLNQLPREELPDSRAIASSAVSQVTSLETAEPKWQEGRELEEKESSLFQLNQCSCP